MPPSNRSAPSSVRPPSPVAAFVLAWLSCLVIAPPLTAQRVVVSPERLRISPDALRQHLSVLRDGGVDTASAAAAASQGVVLEPGTMLVVPTGESIRDIVVRPTLPEAGVLTPVTPVGPRPDPVSPAAPGPQPTPPSGTTSADRELDGVTLLRVLPFRLLAPDASGTGVWTLRPVIKIDRPLRWEAQANAFRGRLAIAVDDSVTPGPPRALPTTVGFRFLGDADSVAPGRVEIRQTNELYFVDVAARDAVDSSACTPSSPTTSARAKPL